MKRDLSKPILYLITPGATTEVTTPDSPEFQNIIEQVAAAVAAEIDLVQLREKRLSGRVLFELTREAVSVTQGSVTRVLVNDRADIAAGAGAHGVHLTTQSIDAATVRKTFGNEFVIGVSTHSVDEARAARLAGADFVVFGPVFETASKREYGAPVGLPQVARLTSELANFPVLALGGITTGNARECLHAGAAGIAAISLFEETTELAELVVKIRR
ncbi:MAG TPA: thiamine phosphate synthase [Pyrinomonadaceae bacterium]|nr:thiamine phosphate synthase [Pyrinomonadaceae bacterium]